MDCYRDEIFGPVLSVVRVTTYDEAVRLVNDNPCGNGTAIFTRDGGVARQFQFEAQPPAWSASTSRSRYPSPTTPSAAGRRRSSATPTPTAPRAIHFYTRGKVVTSRWPRPSHQQGRPGLPADEVRPRHGGGRRRRRRSRGIRGVGESRPRTCLTGGRGPHALGRPAVRPGRVRSGSDRPGDRPDRPTPPVAEPGVGHLRRLVIDIGPLRRHRDYRLLFAGQSVSFLGSMVTFVAIPFQTYQLTGSTLAVGLLALAELGPILTMALLGGALADAYDRRRLVLLSELGLALCAGALLANSVVGTPRVWVLFVVSALMAGLEGIQRPSLDAMAPRLVDRDEITAEAALRSLRTDAGMVIGPAFAGLLIAAVGLPATFGFDVGTSACRFCSPSDAGDAAPGQARRPSLAGILEGLRYAASRPVLIGTYLVDIVAMVFGMSWWRSSRRVGNEFGGPGVLGLLTALRPSVRSWLTLTSGWARRVHPARPWRSSSRRPGWGSRRRPTGFGLSPSVSPLALAFLVLRGHGT